MSQNPVVTMTMESGNSVKIELYPEIAPISVKNFLSLIEKKFYDNVIFHRVIDRFMIQTGGYYIENNTLIDKADCVFSNRFAALLFKISIALSESLYGFRVSAIVQVLF